MRSLARRGLEQDGIVRSGQCAKGEHQRRLASRHDRDFTLAESPSALVDEPRTKTFDALWRKPPPCAWSACGARRGGSEQGERLERCVEVAAAQRHGIARSDCAERGECVRRNVLWPERERLPFEVTTAAAASGTWGDERAGPRSRDDESFQGELLQHAVDGHGAHAVPRQELARFDRATARIWSYARPRLARRRRETSPRPRSVSPEWSSFVG